MIDYCGRPGCWQMRISRSADSRPLSRHWFCSRQCREAVTMPVHWAPPGQNAVACGIMNVDLARERGLEHRFTDDVTLTECGNCKRSDIYRKAMAA